MKFFNFISENDESITKEYDGIKYKVGDKIEIKNTSIDEGTQYGKFIHCISLKGELPIDPQGILFGPRVAILKAKKKDIISYSEDSKCILKKCKVIDIIDTNDLPTYLKTGRNSVKFFTNFLSGGVKKIEYKKEYLDLLMKDFPNQNDIYDTKLFTLEMYIQKLDKYYLEMEEYLLNKNLYRVAIYNALYRRKYTNPILLDKILNENINKKFNWVITFPKDLEKIEETINSSSDILFYCSQFIHRSESKRRFNRPMEKFTEKMSQLPFDLNVQSYIEKIGTNDKLEKEFLKKAPKEHILSYAIKYNRNTEEIKDILKKCDLYNNEEFVKEILAGKEIKDIALSSGKLAFRYIELGGEITEEIKNKIKESSFYTLEYFIYFGLDKNMYSAINNIKDIIEFIETFGADEKFFEAVAEQDYLVTEDNEEYISNFKNYMNKWMNAKNQDIINKILSKEIKLGG